MTNVYEWWAIDENGNKYNDSFPTKSSRSSKVKKEIEKKYKINIDKCKEFGLRKINL